MDRVTFDYSKSLNFIDEQKIIALQERVSSCHDMLHDGTGEGSEFSGWVDLPNTYSMEEFEKIKSVAEEIRSSCDVFIV